MRRHSPAPGIRRRWRRSAAALAPIALVGAAVVAAPAGASPPAPAAPLAVSATTTAGSWVSVPMGHLNDPLNTFWELFYRPLGSSSWTLVTPQGVADNGGLVLDTTSGSAIVGFEPSQDLKLSPLAASSNGGAAWNPGLVPQELAAAPAALAGSPSIDPVALVRSDGGQVLSLSPSLTSSHPLTSGTDLAATAAGRACGIARLTAVGVDSLGHLLLGSSCTHKGQAGVFENLSGTTWSSAGASVPTQFSSSRVVRLTASTSGTSALLEAATAAGHSALLASWREQESLTWLESTPLALASPGALVASGTDGSGGYVVLTQKKGGGLAVERIERGGAWETFAAPPAGTEAIVADGSGGLDAIAVSGARFTDWALAQGATSWVKGQSIEVPIEYGSSN